MISFDNYDSNNNITQYTARNATPVSILWNYLYELPVAQVKNAPNPLPVVCSDRCPKFLTSDDYAGSL